MLISRANAPRAEIWKSAQFIEEAGNQFLQGQKMISLAPAVELNTGCCLG